MAAKTRKISSTQKNAPEFLKNIPQKSTSHKKLIVIQLSGGNDGLNTIVPTRNDLYYKLRPNIAIQYNDAISLDSEYGFNPVMNGLADIYSQGYLNVINAVGYPNPTRSHFKSIDIWHSASDSSKILDTGWIGRYLDSTRTAEKLDNLRAVEIDDLLHLALKGRDSSGVAFENIGELHKALSGRQYDLIHKRHLRVDRFPNAHLEFMYETIFSGKKAVDDLFEQSRKVNLNKSSFPNTELGSELKAVTELILSDAETEIFYVSLGSFDTHSAQLGNHKKLLKELSDALLRSVKILKDEGKFSDTCFMVFSEFGRRVAENGSKGTDHGAGNNMFIISPHLRNPGFYNPHSDLMALVNGDIGYEIDFRRVYATILEDWMGCNSTEILGRSFQKLDLFQQPSPIS